MPRLRDVEPDLQPVRVAADVRRLTCRSVQSQAIPPARVAPRVPWYVYAAAILLLGWAVIVLSVLLTLSGEFGPRLWRAMVLVGLELAVGAGLLFRRRWAWVLGVTTGVVYVAEGLRRLLFVQFEYEWAVALTSYFVPAIVILVGLFPGRARRAFLGE